jgi:hypothetical protein
MDILSSIRRGPARRGWSEMPLLMKAGFLFSTASGIAWGVFIPLAALNIGGFELGGQQVSGFYFLTHGYPLLTPFVAVLVVIAYGFWTERVWVRRLPLVFWSMVGLVCLYLLVSSGITTGKVVVYLMGGVLTLGLTCWYFYGKAKVTSYYRSLAEPPSPPSLPAA